MNLEEELQGVVALLTEQGSGAPRGNSIGREATIFAAKQVQDRFTAKHLADFLEGFGTEESLEAVLQRSDLSEDEPHRQNLEYLMGQGKYQAGAIYLMAVFLHFTVGRGASGIASLENAGKDKANFGTLRLVYETFRLGRTLPYFKVNPKVLNYIPGYMLTSTNENNSITGVAPLMCLLMGSKTSSLARFAVSFDVAGSIGFGVLAMQGLARKNEWGWPAMNLEYNTWKQLFPGNDNSVQATIVWMNTMMPSIIGYRNPFQGNITRNPTAKNWIIKKLKEDARVREAIELKNGPGLDEAIGAIGYPHPVDEDGKYQGITTHPSSHPHFGPFTGKYARGGAGGKDLQHPSVKKVNVTTPIFSTPEVEEAVPPGGGGGDGGSVMPASFGAKPTVAGRRRATARPKKSTLLEKESAAKKTIAEAVAETAAETSGDGG